MDSFVVEQQMHFRTSFLFDFGLSGSVHQGVLCVCVGGGGGGGWGRRAGGQNLGNLYLPHDMMPICIWYTIIYGLFLYH